MCTNQGFKSLIPCQGLEAKYLYHWLQSKTEYLQSLGNGATFKELSKKTLSDIRIPLPDLDTQRSIASILDQADALRAKRGRVLIELGTLPQTIFWELFGNPDNATRTQPLGEVASLSAGRNLVAEDSTVASEYRVLKISAVTSGVFKANESKALPVGYTPPADHLVARGDLLMSRANTAALVGATALVEGEAPNLALPDKIWRFQWRDERSVPAFYQALLQTRSIRHRISRMASGTGGSMKNVAKSNLLAMQVPKVSFAEQQLFAHRIAQVSLVRASARLATQATDSMFVALQARAFRGEL